MQRLKALLQDQSGFMPLITAAFVLVAISVGITAWVIVSQVQATQRQVQTALAYALSVAAVQGTTTLTNGAFLVSQPAVLAAAQQAVPLALPVHLSTLTTNGATYTPTSSAPAAWGILTLSGVTVGNGAQAAGGAICYGSSPPLASCPYVQATISLPCTVSLFGFPISLTDTDTETQVLDTFNGQSFGS